MSQFTDLYDTAFKTERSTLSESDRSAAGNESWDDHLTDKLCALQEMSAREKEEYAKVTPGAEFKMFTDETDILHRDRVVIDSDTYEVAEVRIPALGVTRVILSRRIED